MLTVLIIGIFIGYLIAGKRSSQDTYLKQQIDSLQRIINSLVSAAQGEATRAKTKATKDALERVVEAGYIEQYGYVPKTSVQQDTTPSTVASSPVLNSDATLQVSVDTVVAQQADVPQLAISQQHDNTSMLLYFGAFLFMASAGLFVAFGDVEPKARTIIIGVVAGLLYLFGLYLHSKFSKLQEAGLTFVGIGMALVPLVGVAAYYYSYDESNARSIWLATSTIALFLYAFTLLKLRSTIISYMLIASIVSLFESSIGILNMPSYYFLWGLIVVGAILQAMSLMIKSFPELKDASSQSSRVLIPLTMIASTYLASSLGLWQLGVTMLLGSVHYSLQYFVEKTKNPSYLYGAHTLFIIGVSLLMFAKFDTQESVSIVLLCFAVLHTFLVAFIPTKANSLSENFINVSLISAIAGVLVSLGLPQHMSYMTMAVVVLSAVVAMRFKRYDAAAIGLVGWLLLSVLLGQALPDERISDSAQAILTFGFSIPLFMDSVVKSQNERLHEYFKFALIAAHILAMLFGALAGEYGVLLISLAGEAMVLALAEINKSTRWAELIVLYSLAPIAYVLAAVVDPYQRSLPLFTVSVLFALAINIALSLRYKLESARWISATAWLALPFALGIEKIGFFTLSPDMQMWLYVAVALVLGASRAIARGRLFMAKKNTLASLAKNSSQSYEFGLLIACGVAASVAFISTQIVAVSVLVVVIAGAIVVLQGTLIDRESHYLAIIPWVAQLALLRSIEPYSANSWLSEQEFLTDMYVGLSSFVALAFYAWASTIYKLNSDLRASALATAFIAPVSVIYFSQSTLAMPVGLIVASLMLLQFGWNRNDLSERENVGYVTLSGVFWLLLFQNVTNLQVFTHLVALQFAFYAYIRFQRRDEKMVSNYLTVMLSFATIPLGLRALGDGEAGDLYGIWLLIENIFFMILGVTIQNKLVTRWGLYFATGSVLYQLRGLGWAMLTVLALFVIGIAISRALKQPDQK